VCWECKKGLQKLRVLGTLPWGRTLVPCKLRREPKRSIFCVLSLFKL
jgi:hypothetical protein